MNVTWTDEQRTMQQTVRQFAKTEVALVVERMEKGEFPRNLLKKMGERGFMGITTPISLGGADIDFTTHILVIHEVSKVSATIGAMLSLHTSAIINSIIHFGNQQQKQKYVPKLAKGEYVGAFCLAESQSSELASLKTRAVKNGDRYIINGSKVFVQNGGEAHLYIIFASTSPELGSRGISAFVVNQYTPGLIIGKSEQKMGLNGLPMVQLTFDNMVVTKEQMLGAEGDGVKIAMHSLDERAIGTAAISLGIAEAALEVATVYAKKHEQFHLPLIANEGISFKLADMATAVEASKLLVYRAASFQTKGLPCNKEASMAKWFASQTAVNVTNEAMQIIGEYSFLKSSPLERYFRDAKMTQMYDGTSLMPQIVISKHVLS